jgi:hypothetical protein
MSYFPELLIETHKELRKIAKQHRMLIEACRDQDNYPNPKFLEEILSEQLEMVAARLYNIEKRMRSLGYHDCWGDSKEEVVVP